jgi:hypothetical protein
MQRTTRAPIFAFAIAIACCAVCGPLAGAQEAATPAAPAAAVLHTASVVAAAWFALSFLVNLVFHVATPKDVDAWAERNPWLARLAAIARRAGIEPVALFTELKNFFSTNPPPPSLVGGNVAMGKRHPYRGDAPVSTAAPKSAGYIDTKVAVVLGCIGLGLVACAIACGVLGGAPAIVPDTIALDDCVAGVVHEHPGADFETVAIAAFSQCADKGAKELIDVIDVFLRSKDPAVTTYRAAAAATKNDPAKLQALRSHVRDR